MRIPSPHLRALISHPPDASGKPIQLYDHLSDTSQRAAALILRLKSGLNLAVPADDLAKAAFIAGCTHDFGKAKQQFQEYIWGGKAKDKDHAAISSVFAFVVVSHVFGQKQQPTRLLPFVCAYAVNRHHARLCNIEESFEEASIEHQIAVARGKIDARIWDFVMRCEPLELTLRFSDYREQFEGISAQQITECFQKFGQLLRQRADEANPSESWLVDLYFALLLVVSTLTEADVACVIQAPEPKQAVSLDPERICQYASEQPQASTSFQELRKRAWEEIQRAVKEPDTSAFRLTLPTGLGKTLMGLYFSAAVQRKHEDVQRSQPVIYALPYLSIIEQATDVARRVFPRDETGVSVIQHHGLSFPESKSDEEANFEKARFALEDWDADLVVTTFDQLFYSFLANDRGFIRRFFRLPRAVLLLDEVQTIPARLIPAVDTLLQRMREKLGVEIVYMTATHPPFLKAAKSLVQNAESYFQQLERTRLRLQLEPIKFSEYASQLGDWLRERRGKKLLIVANTIRSARDLFVHLAKLREDEAEFQTLKLFHLSGSVVPIERLRRIKEIRKLIRSEPEAWIGVVSTQCVEAGVDLDMDEAVRDFAPWDSLLQICGRANRFGKRSCADVWVYRWMDDATENPREFHSYIYDPIFADATLKVLQGRTEVPESAYLAVQQEYVRELEERLSPEASKEILRAALAWRFDDLDFKKLFRGQEEAWKVPLFCVADQTADYLKNVASELWSSKNLDAALDLLDRLCASEKLFGPLEGFLQVKSESVCQQLKSLEILPARRKRFAFIKLLQPMLQAYTISVPVRQLEDLSYGRITEWFLYLSQSGYRKLNAICDINSDDEDQRVSDQIV